MKGLKHPSPAVRRAAILALPRHPAAATGLSLAGVLEDPDPQVRLAACLAMSEMPRTEDGDGAARILLALLDQRNQQDRWMGDALTIAAAAHAPEYLRALARRGLSGPDGRLLIPVTARVAEHYARGGPVDSIASILALQGDMKPVVRDALIGGLAKGWPRDKKPALDTDAQRGIAGLLPTLPPEARGQMLGLASRWGVKGLDAFVARLAGDFLAAASDASKTEAARIEAARQLIDLRKTDGQAARDVIALVTSKAAPDLASGLISAVARSDSPEVGPALVDAIGPMTPAARKASVLALLGKTDWTSALVRGIEQEKVAMSLLSLDQSQALAAHPDSKIAERARALLARGGGLPDLDREKVIQTLAPIVLKGGDAARGKEIFKKECLKCHAHSGEGGKVGPDLTGMAAHPRSELIVHILDPSRSVEGNYLQYTVSTTDGRTLSGLLAGETRTSIDLLDSEGKKQTILREDIEALAASKKSVMPEGFEKSVPPEGLADLLQFLTQKGRYLPLDLRKVATLTTTDGVPFGPGGAIGRLIFEDWGPKVVDGVPFTLVDPQGGRQPNAVMLGGPSVRFAAKMPRSVTLPVNAPARAIHLLFGVAGGGYPSGGAGTVSTIVRIHYEDGKTEDHELKNGVHFADVNGAQDVPGSKLAFKLRGQQVRYLTVTPKSKDPIASIELVKGPDRTAPIVLAATVEGFE
jgi:putative heme-binding domain-containing protein